MQGQVTIDIAASPERVYELASDITRYGEWSPENKGGVWLDGATGPAVGARFKGKNKRRISWSTKCTVLAADPGKEFSFGVGKKSDTIWRYAIQPNGSDGSTVTESYELDGEPNWIEKFLVKIVTGLSWDQRGPDLEKSMGKTLAGLKAAAEKG